MKRARPGILIPMLLCLASMASTGLAETPAPAAAKGQEQLDPTAQRGEAYARLMRAMVAARRGDFRSALSDMREAIELQPESIDVHIQVAEMMGWLGRDGEAERTARKALELAPQDPRAIGYLADMIAEVALGPGRDATRRRDALALYERLRESGAKLDADQLRRVATLRLLDDDIEAATRAAEELVADRPGDPQATRFLVQVYLRQDREDEALRLNLNYLARHPNDTEILDEARQLAESTGGWATVIELLEGHEELDGRATATHAFLGEVLLLAGRVEPAADALERGLLFDATDPATRFNLLLAYRELGRLGDAAAIAGGLAREHPSNYAVQRELAETLTRQQDLDGALDAYESALRILEAELDPADAERRDYLRRRIAQNQLQQGEPQVARRYVALLEQPDEAVALRLAARVALASSDHERAREIAARLRKSGENVLATVIEGEAFLGEERWNKAADRFAAAIAEGGPEVGEPIARAWREAGRPDRAQPLLEALVEARPEEADAHFALGVHHYEEQAYEASDAAMLRAIELDPNHAAALNYMGYALAERGERLDEALELVERALAVDPWNGAYLDSLGWVHFQRGDLKAAREPLERAARQFPKDPTILSHLGDLYAGLGEYELARDAWLRALEADEESRATLQAKLDALPEGTASVIGAGEDDAPRR